MVNRVRRAVEKALPWYDPEAEARRDARSAAVHRRSITARIRAEHVADAYRRADRTLGR